MRRLSAMHRSPFGEENLLLAGTHTHSAPGGFAGMLLYDYTDGGVDDATVECIVEGCVRAIEMAQANLAPAGSTPTATRSPTADATARLRRTCAIRRPSATATAPTRIARCCC